MIVLLTATVTPQVDSNLQLVDPESRREQYRHAVRQWAELCTQTKMRLILVENSGEDLTKLVESAIGRVPPSVRLLESANPPLSLASRGKGATEGLMVDQAVASLKNEADDELLFKCTGRLFVKNFQRTLGRTDVLNRQVYADIPRSMFDWLDSRYFGASMSIWRNELRGVGSTSDDSRGVNFEHELARVINQASAAPDIRVRNFREKPWIVGQSGTTGTMYGDGRLISLKLGLRRPLDRLRRRIDSEYVGH